MQEVNLSGEKSHTKIFSLLLLLKDARTKLSRDVFFDVTDSLAQDQRWSTTQVTLWREYMAANFQRMYLVTDTVLVIGPH